MKFFSKALVCVCALSICAAARGQNLISNGSFQSGNFADWTLSGNPSDLMVTSLSYGSYFHPDAGDKYYAMLGSFGSESFLSQTVSTNIGGNYDITFDLASDGGHTNQLTVDAGSNVLLNLSNIAAQGYTEYSELFVATSTSTTIKIGTRDDPGYLLLDNVSVVDPPPPASTPLPATVWSALVPMAGLIGYRTIRRKFIPIPV
jgi:hypothetical protein